MIICRKVNKSSQQPTHDDFNCLLAQIKSLIAKVYRDPFRKIKMSPFNIDLSLLKAMPVFQRNVKALIKIYARVM